MAVFVFEKFRGTYSLPSFVVAASVSVFFFFAWFTAFDPLETGKPLVGMKWPIGPTLLAVVLSAEWYMEQLLKDVSSVAQRSEMLAAKAEKR